MSAAVFVSYRRKDQPFFVRTLAERLSTALPDHRVFIDVDSIGGGNNFRREIESALLLADDEATLGHAWGAMAGWLREHRHLALKPMREGIVSTRAGITLLGWRITRGGLAPARTGRLRLLRRIRARMDQGPATITDMLSPSRHRWAFG